MYRAVSDQLYGNEKAHGEIRKKVVEYLRSHQADFAAFIVAKGAGMVRESSRRRCRKQAAVDQTVATEDAADLAFKNYCKEAAKPTTKASDLELSIIGILYSVNILVWQADRNYLATNDEERDKRRTLHLAFHVRLPALPSYVVRRC